MSETKGLSLFSIEAGLRDLLYQREDVLDRMAAMGPDELTASPEIGQELSVVEGLIKDYMRAEVKKVDNIAFAVRNEEASGKAKAEASAELDVASKRHFETAKRIKQWALEILQELGSPGEAGRLYRLTRQGNGGIRPLVIAQPDLIPDSFRVVSLQISLSFWSMLTAAQPGLTGVARIKSIDPDGQAIRESLERGEGVPGARLDERGEHLRVK